MNEVKRKSEEKAVSFSPASTRCRSHLLSHYDEFVRVSASTARCTLVLLLC
jgi:hypothetical protein